MAAYSASGALIGWQVINRSNSFGANGTYDGTFDFAAAGLNPVDVSGVTLRVWQGTAGSGYGTANNTSPAVTYRSATSLAGGSATGFRVNSTSAPTATGTTNGALNLTGTVTAGSAQATFNEVSVNTVLPSTTATITAINDNVGIFQGVVASGGRTDDTQVSLSGTLSAALTTGQELRIYAGTTLLGTATVNGTGWTFNDSRIHANNTALSYIARVAAANGNLGTASAAYTATVDTAAPTLTASISSISDNVGAQQGTVARGGSTDDQTPTLVGTYSGSLASGDTIRIFNGSTLLGTATITSTLLRTWSFTPTTLPAGAAYSFVARVADQAGNLGGTVTNSTYNITISGAPSDTTAPTVSSITYGTNDGAIAAGESITLIVTLSEAVNVTGTPSLALNTGGSATYTSGSGTNTLTFTYTAAAPHSTADLATAAANALTGTITDLAGNAVVAAGFNGVNPTGTVAVDTSVATPSLALAQDTGTAGDGISTNGTVNVSGLETGATWQYSTDSGANWQAGTGNSFVLAPANYTANSIQARQTDVAGNVSSIGQISSAISILSFTVNENADVVSFGGNSNGGPITVSIATNGTASFSRDGITASTTVTQVGTKVINSDAGTALVVELNGTNSADNFTFNAPNATDISLKGDLDAATDSVAIKVADLAGVGNAGQRSLKIVTSDLTATGDTLVFDFADAKDTVALSTGSVITGFTTVEVRSGTVDFDSAILPSGLNVVVNSGAVFSVAQFLALASVQSGSGLGQIQINITSQTEYANLLSFLANQPAGFLAGTTTSVDPTSSYIPTQQEQANLNNAIATVTIPSFSFSELNNIVSFSGPATGPITVILDNLGNATFSRQVGTPAQASGGLPLARPLRIPGSRPAPAAPAPWARHHLGPPQNHAARLLGTLRP